MRILSRRTALAGALAITMTTTVVATPETASADIWGADIPLLTGILGNAVATVTQLASMASQMAYQIKMLETMIKNLDHASFLDVVQFISAARMTFNTLSLGIQSLTYKLNRIDAEYRQLFPSSHPPAAPPAQHQQQYHQWHQEIVAASHVAARQQTSIATLDAHATKVQGLVQQSQGAGGQIASQLQLIVQSLALVVGELITLNQTLATTGRVLTDVAAAEASGKLLSAQKKDDARDGYTNKGAPVVVSHTLP